MNKNILSLALAVALIALPMDVEAGGLGMSRKKRNRLENYFVFTFSGGYSNLLTHTPVANPNGFIGGSVGLGYEMHKEGLLFSATGELECMTSSIGINRSVLDDAAKAEGVDVSYNVARWHDCPHYLFLSMPLLLGYTSDVFYVGAGPKLMLCIFGRSRNYINYSVDGDSYSTRSSAYPARNAFNIAACLDVGATVIDGSKGRGRSRSGVTLKLGLTAEYGFLNINAAKGSGSVVNIGNDERHTLSVIPLFTSNSMTNTTVNPLYVGAKLTLLFAGL